MLGGIKRGNENLKFASRDGFEAMKRLCCCFSFFCKEIRLQIVEDNNKKSMLFCTQPLFLFLVVWWRF